MHVHEEKSKSSLSVIMLLPKSLPIFCMLYLFSDARISHALGGPQVCTIRDTGKVDCPMTEYCCSHINHKAYWSTAQRYCLPNAGAAGNSVDTGQMVKCCEGNGGGSNAYSILSIQRV